MKIMTWNSLDLNIGVTGDHLRGIPSPGPTTPHLVVTYHYHGHPIITNPYKSAKNKNIDMKLSGYDNEIRLDWIRLDQMRSDEIRWDQMRSDDIRWDQNGSYEIRWDHIWSDQIRSDQMKLEDIRCHMRSDKIRWDQMRSYETRWDQIGSDQIIFVL